MTLKWKGATKVKPKKGNLSSRGGSMRIERMVIRKRRRSGRAGEDTAMSTLVQMEWQIQAVE
jgi:hypothetical protein